MLFYLNCDLVLDVIEDVLVNENLVVRYLVVGGLGFYDDCVGYLFFKIINNNFI